MRDSGFECGAWESAVAWDCEIPVFAVWLRFLVVWRLSNSGSDGVASVSAAVGIERF